MVKDIYQVFKDFIGLVIYKGVGFLSSQIL